MAGCATVTPQTWSAHRFAGWWGLSEETDGEFDDELPVALESRVAPLEGHVGGAHDGEQPGSGNEGGKRRG